MTDTMPKPGDELIRLADLEWLDLSDLIRMDDDWRHTLVTVSRTHLAVDALVALVVVGYVLLARGIQPTGIEYGAIGIIAVGIALMAWLVVAAHENETRLLRNLRFVVFLSILVVSSMVFLLRDLQGDYYLLYFLPLVSAAGYLGFTGGLCAGVVSALAYTVVFFISPVSLAPGSLSALILRTLIFVLAASLLGLIAERHLSLLSALRASHTQAVQFAVTDTKTGLFNQDYLQSRLRGEISRAERSHAPVAFLVVDVGGLERINREHGYSTGDTVLKEIGGAIRKQLRQTDIPSRWGVDEFGVLLYNSDAQGAEIVARRIAADVGQRSFADPATHREFSVAVSEGIAVYPAHTQDLTGSELVDRAYQAMRRARSEHPVVVWS